MSSESLSLRGCTPTPLASYLKALGVLRLISSSANHTSGEAADPQARGWWENECFHLKTTLSRNAMLQFFLHDYAPSPIIAPWNGRAGFLEGDAGGASRRSGAVLMRAVENSECSRLHAMRRTVATLRNNSHLVEYDRLRAEAKRLRDNSKTLSGEEKRLNDSERVRIEKQAQTVKALLLPNLRSETDAQHVDYIDACYVLASDETPAPLLGSGGNDGSRDFGVNFGIALREVVDFQDGTPTDRGLAELPSALLDVSRPTEAHGSMGQFNPGQGGPNATTGYEGDNPLNAWEVVLAMEGTLTFVGALTRRWGATSGNRAAFPFTFEPIGAGTGSLSSEDPNRPRGEVWTPIWSKPATFSEVAAVFAEGRLTLGHRAARTGLDAARSIARVGAARGIEAFERYSIIQPDAKMPHQATPIGRFGTPHRPRSDLISDLEAGDWLSRFRRLVANRKTAPARARQAMRRLEDALFQMTAANTRSDGTRNALIALGGLVGWLASNPTIRKDIRPPPLISSNWVHEADDGSAEFRVATALAGLGLPSFVRSVQNSDAEAERPVDTGDDQSALWHPNAAPPMAAHFAPLDERSFFHQGYLAKRRRWADEERSPTAVWRAGPLVPNLIAVLERRLVEASTRGLDDKPLFGATGARLSEVAPFLAADFDDERCAALVAGLVWARPARLRAPSQEPSLASVPFAYAALKPVFAPNASLLEAGALAPTATLPVPSELVAHLRVAGDSFDAHAHSAVQLALARARASGFPTPFADRQGTRHSATQGGRIGTGVAPRRLAAALLIPIDDRALSALIERAYPDARSDYDNNTTEATTHAV